MFSFKVLHFFYKNAASLSVFGCTRVETLTPQQLEHLRILKENREIDRLSFIVVVAGCKKRKKGQTWPTALSGRKQNRSWSHVWTWQVYSVHSCAQLFIRWQFGLRSESDALFYKWSFMDNLVASFSHKTASPVFYWTCKLNYGAWNNFVLYTPQILMAALDICAKRVIGFYAGQFGFKIIGATIPSMQCMTCSLL